MGNKVGQQAKKLSSEDVLTQATLDSCWSGLGVDELSYSQAVLFLKQFCKNLGCRFDRERCIEIIAACDPQGTGKLAKQDFERVFFSHTLVLRAVGTLKLSDSMSERAREAFAVVDVVSCPSLEEKDKKAARDAMRARVNLVRARLGRSAAFDIQQAADIWECPWEQAVAQGVKTAERGHTSTIFFVPFTDGRRVCVKMSDNVARECLGSALARQLGIAAPEVRFVARSDAEFSRIIAVLERAGEAVPELAGRVRKAGQFKGLLLVQWVSGTPLDDAIFKKGAQSLHRKTWEALGALLLLDVVLRNTDRLPLLWEHPGNLGNVMLQEMSVGPPRVVAIDNTPAELREANISGRDAYLQQVQSLLGSLLGEPDSVNASFARVAQSMGGCDTAAILSMQHGFLKGVARVDEAFLDEALDFIAAIGGDHPFWKKGLAALDASFFKAVIDIIQKTGNGSANN